MRQKSIISLAFISTLVVATCNAGASEDSEFGSRIAGKLYSANELALWKERSVNGPHLYRGDAYGATSTGSYPSYSITQSSAEAFDSYTDEEIVLDGISKSSLEEALISQEELDEIDFVELDGKECAVLDPNNGNTRYDYYEFGRFDLARDAAFVDLINDTSANSARIKSLLVQQAQATCMDFSNREIFRNGINNNTFWLYLEWIHKAFKAYDYLDESIFTEEEKTVVDNWFKGAAEWSYYYTSTRHMGGVYKTRASDPIDSVINLPNSTNPANTGFWLNREAYSSFRIRYEGSSIFWPAGYMINNRHVGHLNFVVHAGVKYDNEDWKKEGAQIVKEYVSFHFDDDGYFAELNRASDKSSGTSQSLGIPVKAVAGLAYGANTLVNIVEMAHILYLDGYENLFEYRSLARINEESGEIEEGTVEKSLEWVLLSFRKNFMLADAPEIYPSGLTEEESNSDTVIHFCNNTHREKLGTNRVIGRMYNPAVITNRYYKNPLIKEIYNFSNDYGNICELVDTNLEIVPGPHGISPSLLFQYSDADESY